MIDKTHWTHKITGPWDDEPTGKQWLDETTGLPCLIIRQATGHLCGYVGVPYNHPWHGRDYNKVNVGIDVDVHGGLTFAGDAAALSTDFALQDYWWLGFDCAHHFDLVPGSSLNTIGEYRDMAYVEAECTSLAIAAARITCKGKTTT